MVMAPGTTAVPPAMSAAAALTSTYRRLIALCDALDSRIAPRARPGKEESVVRI